MGGNAMSIVVGVDGSDQAIDAARWAGAVAARLGMSLHLVHIMRGVDEALLIIASAQQEDAGSYPRKLGQEVLDRTADKVRADSPGLRISRTLSEHSMTDALTDLSRRARLVVLACDDVSPAGALLVGSATLAVARHSACPVVAWRGGALAPTDAPIVVGVDDDDEGSHAALVAAFELGDGLGVGVTAVHALPERRGPGEVNIPFVIDWEALESEALHRLSVIVNKVAVHWPNVDVSFAIGTGKPGAVILHHAVGAQLVVTGSRGKGNVASALLGSTGLSLLHHSPTSVVLCPMVSVRDEATLEGDQILDSAHAGPR